MAKVMKAGVCIFVNQILGHQVTANILYFYYRILATVIFFLFHLLLHIFIILVLVFKINY
jgi:hypothetical protein